MNILQYKALIDELVSKGLGSLELNINIMNESESNSTPEVQIVEEIYLTQEVEEECPCCRV